MIDGTFESMVDKFRNLKEGERAEFVIEIFNVYNRRNEWFVQYDTSGEVTDPSVVGMLPMIPSLGVNVEF